MGGTQEEANSKVLPPLRRHKESMCKSKERESRTRKKKKIAAKMEQLREKEDNQERVVHGEENKNE